jgi:serine/threonine-protein kinase RsbW
MHATKPEPASLELRPEIGELARLSEFIEDFAAQHEWTAADTHAFTLAAEELFANTINHSRPPATRVELRLASGENRAVAMYLDDGAAYDPTKRAPTDTTEKLERRALGGLGVHFIRKTMTLFTYERVDENNVVRFGRVLSEAATEV